MKSKEQNQWLKRDLDLIYKLVEKTEEISEEAVELDKAVELLGIQCKQLITDANLIIGLTSQIRALGGLHIHEKENLERSGNAGWVNCYFNLYPIQE